MTTCDLLGIPRVKLIEYERRQEARRLLDHWDEIRKRDAVTRKAFNHGLYGKDYRHRSK